METLTIDISKDIREYEPKLIGNFTNRQVISLLCIAGILGLWQVLLKKVFGFEQITYIPVAIPSCVVALYGWGNLIFGMPAETYLKIWTRFQFEVKQHRVFRTHNYITEQYEKVLEERRNLEEGQKVNEPKKKIGKKTTESVNPRYISCD